MNTWMYIIKGKGMVTMTQNPWFAEQRSKNGYQVFCKRSTNTYRNEWCR